MAVDPNTLIWVSDQHVVSNDSEAGVVGETKPREASAFVSHIIGQQPYGFIDTGDCKDHSASGGDATGTQDEHDNYKAIFYNRIPWLSVNPARPGDTIHALKPILPGNHDEEYNYNEAGVLPGGTDFGPFDAKFWAAPYHWTADWPAPKIRFIAVHTYVIHAPSASQGGAQIDSTEIDWLADELAALPAGWRAVVCSHFPILTTFGNNVLTAFGQTTLLALLAANSAKIVACFSGHRHVNLVNAVQDGIRHFTGLSTAYTVSNGSGMFAILKYRPATNDIKIYGHYGPGASSNYGAMPTSLYTPVILAL